MNLNKIFPRKYCLCNKDLVFKNIYSEYKSTYLSYFSIRSDLISHLDLNINIIEQDNNSYPISNIDIILTNNILVNINKTISIFDYQKFLKSICNNITFYRTCNNKSCPNKITEIYLLTIDFDKNIYNIKHKEDSLCFTQNNKCYIVKFDFDKNTGSLNILKNINLSGRYADKQIFHNFSKPMFDAITEDKDGLDNLDKIITLL